MLIIKRLINQIERQYVILINTYKSNKDDVVFAIKVHSKLIEDNNNIQSNKIFTVSNLS